MAISRVRTATLAMSTSPPSHFLDILALRLSLRGRLAETGGTACGGDGAGLAELQLVGRGLGELAGNWLNYWWWWWW